MERIRKWRYRGLGNLLLAGWLAATGGELLARPQPVAVTDDAGQRIDLPAPARRVIALSPSLTELAFAAGGGARLVGVAEHSNYPEAARSLPRVGDALSFQIERILALEPDLILAWQQGNNPRQLERLAALGIPIYYSRIGRLEDVATTLERLGTLLGSPAQAAADDFRRRLATFDAATAPAVKVLYQVWAQPLMTVNGRHVISDLIARCGGVNVFASESALVPQVGIEAAVAAAPEVIIAAGTAGSGSAGTGGVATGGLDAGGVGAGGVGAGEGQGSGPLEHWRRYPVIPAVARDFLFLVDGDAVSRPGPRLLEAGAEICRHLDRARRAR